MSNYRKFMFDNFVLDEDEDEKEAEETAEEELPTSEELPSEMNVVDEDILQAQEQVEEPEEEIVEEPEEKVKTYTQDELDSALLIAEQKGYEKGFKSASESQENDKLRLLASLEEKITLLSEDDQKLKAQMSEKFLDFAQAIVKKLVPEILEKQSVEIVNSFIEKNFANFQSEEKLSFYINPEVIGDVQSKIAEMAHKTDFEGKIALHKDAGLAKYDCRVEWENGGVELQNNKILEKVDNLLEEEQAKN